MKRRLLELLRNPETLPGVTGTEWNALVPVLRRERLLSQLGAFARRTGVFDQLPGTLQDLCRGSAARVEHTRRLSLYIAEEITQSLSADGIRVALLKGAAYAAAGYNFADGRMFSDLDILVRREDMADTEVVLRKAGWKPDDMDAADERYYREWMHELPPFKHATVPFELDIHHNLAPPVSRIQLNTTPFWSDAITLEQRGLTVLSPTHMLIHTAVHLFFNDELRGGIRELLDIHGLCHLVNERDEAWSKVAALTATQPMLARTLFYALDTAQRLLGTPVNPKILLDLRTSRITDQHLSLMRWLFDRALLDDQGIGAGLAQQVLFLRSHWLRMPAGLLLPHLARKSWLRLRTLRERG